MDLMLLQTMAIKCLVAAIPAIGFAMLFNVPKQFLLHCAIAGSLGYLTRLVTLEFGLQLEIAALLGAIVVGSLSTYWSRRYFVPVQIIAIAAVIPMIPGSYAFTVMVGLIEMSAHHNFSEELIAKVLNNGLKTIFGVIALALGIAIPRLFFLRARPVV